MYLNKPVLGNFLVFLVKSNNHTSARISHVAGAGCRPISSGGSRRLPVAAGRPDIFASALLSHRE